jgi:hypothetical protein
MNDFSDYNFTVMPSWVVDYKTEYENHINTLKYLLRAILFVIISAVILVFYVNITQYCFLMMIISVFVLIKVVLRMIKYPFRSYEFLSSVIYETGFLLNNNNDPKPQNYIKNIDTLLGNFNLFIDNIEKSIVGSFYVINIRLFCKKLRKLIMLLNEYSKNHDKYSIDKSDISIQLINLANSIYKEKEDINKHIKLIDLLNKDLQKDNLREKPIKISLYDSFKRTTNEIYKIMPQYIRSIIIAIIVSIVVFISIFSIGLWFDIEKDTLFCTSVTVAVVIMLSTIPKKM